MFNLDIIQTYFPEMENISPAALQSARTRVVAWLAPHFGDIDMSPGTVFGDKFVAPAAAFIAATEEAHGRFMSDLDLQQVANKIIYSCEFVEKYLGNFGVYQTDTLQSTGIVRITFSVNKAYDINRGIRFAFGTDDEYSLRLPSDDTDDFHVLPAGSITTGAANEVVLAQTGVNSWAVDLPVTGTMNEAVLRGASGTSTFIFPEEIGIAAAVDFEQGLPPASLPELAKLARRMAYSASCTSRNGTRSFVFQAWPETAVCSPVISGDVEMQRSPGSSAMVLQAPAVDVYYRSKRDMQLETVTVKLPYVGGVFRGLVNFINRPGLFESIRWAGNIAMEMVSTQVFSSISRSDLAGSIGCGTRYEHFWLDVVPPPRDGGGILVDLVNDENGDPYAMFTITYRTDPLLRAVSDMLESGDNAPVGVSVLVKSGPLIRLNSLTIRYVRKPGVRMLLDQARAEIAEYIRSAGYPDAYSESMVIRTMHTAGASRVAEILYDGVIKSSSSDYRFLPGVAPDETVDWVANAFELPQTLVTDVYDMSPDLVGSDEFDTYAFTDRTVRYYIDPADILFLEV